MIGTGHFFQSMAGVALLAAGLALSVLAKAFGSWFLEAVTGGRLIAVTTVLLQLSLKRGDLLLQRFHLLLEAFYLLLQQQNVIYQGLEVFAS